MKNRPLVFLDTNIFIYYFEGHEIFGKQAQQFFQRLANNEITAVTSVLTQLELLSSALPQKQLDILLHLFLETPNLVVHDVTAEISSEAAKLRRKYRFRTPDAIQLATALVVQADTFVTNDQRLQICTEITVELLSQK